MIKQFYFQLFNLALVIYLHSVKMSNSYTWLIDRALSGATTRSQSEPRSNGNEGVHHIFQHYWNLTIRLFNIISGHSLEMGVGSYPSAEMQSVYSTAPDDCAI